jgi:hypothetical protein
VFLFDRLIDEAVVDCSSESEAITAFVTIIEDHLKMPFVTSVLGTEVVVDGVDLTPEGSIVALCRRGRFRQPIPILRLPIPKPMPRGGEWVEAYRGWARRISR